MGGMRACLAVVSLLSCVAAAQSPKNESPQQAPQRAEALAQVRVLVGVSLEEAYRAEGELDAAQANAQRGRIAVAQRRVADLIGRLGGSAHTRYAFLPYVAAQIDAQMLGELVSSPLVSDVAEERLRQPTLLRSTVLTGAKSVWAHGFTGAGWAVALPDTGVDAMHPFLVGKVIAEACDSSTFGGGTMQPGTVSLCPGGVEQSTMPGAGSNCDPAFADCDHGTHVAGIIAGRQGPEGLSGVAPGASLIALQIYSRLADGTGIGAWDSDLIRALERVYAMRGEHRIAAVNLSLAGGEVYGDQPACDAEHPALKDAVALLRSVGIATVVAAGNDASRTALAAPACLSGVISVGASCDDGPDRSFCARGVDTVADYSNVSPFLSLLAPGSYITSSIPGNGYETLSGTSLAAPHVAGAFALLRQQDPLLTVEAVLRRLRESAAPVDDARDGAIVRELMLLDVRGVVAAMATETAGIGAGSRQAASAQATAPAVATAPSNDPTPIAEALRPSATRSSAAGGGTAESGTSAASPTSSSTVAAIGAGSFHTCALTGGGGVKCWGSNISGQLGDNSTQDRLVPADVVGLTSRVTAIAAGYAHTCALTIDGGVKCWGSGGVGDGTSEQRLVPVDVVGLTSGVSAIAARDGRTCALTSGGGVKCWGENATGPGQHSAVPVDVTGLSSGVTAIAVGDSHTCALTSGGGVKCWGYNSYGQLGDGSTTDRWTPSDVNGLTSGVAAITAGSAHSCARTTEGAIRCWGYNSSGQLGDGSTAQRTSPVDVAGLTSGVLAVQAGSAFTCALVSGGGVKCWGNNYSGQLGDNSDTNRSTPADVVGLGSGVAELAAGVGHACALTVNAGVKCWGANYFGQLGDNSTTARWTPANVVGLRSGVAAITAGGSHTCALTSGGVKCWGANDRGQLGDDSTTARWTPVDVVGLSSGVAAMTAGYSHTCALTSGGGVKCWGANDRGQLGDDSTTDRWTPVDVVGLSSGVAAISAGNAHTCALTSGGAVKCWGYNYFGKLGDDSTTDRWTPIDVVGLSSGVSAITAGNAHTCALTSGGAVKCWGYNEYGQLGDNSTIGRWTPVDVVGLAGGVTAIEAGSYHTCALINGGGVKCWGFNYWGLLGDASTTDRWAPVDVAGLAGGVQAMAPAQHHTCALTSGGAVKCWGGNWLGQLGDGSGATQLVPVDVVGLASGAVAIESGSNHTCALTSDGGIKCWGWNGWGQLGDGSTTARSIPVDVVGLSAIQVLTVTRSGTGAGTVTSAPVGINCGTDCTESYASGTVVALTATADSGSKFVGWSGACAGTGTCVVGMTEAREVTANFSSTGPSPLSAIAAGADHTCVLSGAGHLGCWGYNGHGQLGDGTNTNRTTPAYIVFLFTSPTDVTAGANHTCMLTSEGGLKCWGENSHGQLGDNTSIDRWGAVDVVGLASDMVAVSAGAGHTCARTSGGAVKCWGDNSNGQVGDGTPEQRLTPVDVTGLGSGVAAIAAGAYHSCALTAGGGVKCWGSNSHGQLGDGTTTDRWTAVDVVGLGSGVVSIAAGYRHTCAVTAAGWVKCWGKNDFGQLGDNSTIDRSTPVDVVNLINTVVAISAGEDHSCSLNYLGGVKCWGRNASGQLGDGGTANRLAAIDVVGLNGGVSAIAAGGNHTCALTAAGGAKCWGRNATGQLGDSTTANRATPVAVSGIADVVPDSFSFTAQTSVAQGAQVTSEAITPGGFDTPTSIEVASGVSASSALAETEAPGSAAADSEYSIGCTAAFTSAPGSISPGQSVCLRHTASSTPGTTVTTTLAIGGVAGTFSSTTVASASYALTVIKSGTGSGTVTSIPPGISCGTDCTEAQAAGTVITLVATADSGSTFAGWSGGGCTGADNCVISHQRGCRRHSPVRRQYAAHSGSSDTDGGFGSQLRADQRRRGQVLGLEQATASSATAPTRFDWTAVDVVGLGSGVVAIAAGRRPHLRVDQRRRGQVLGRQRVRPARRRQHHGSQDAGGRDGARPAAWRRSRQAPITPAR